MKRSIKLGTLWSAAALAWLSCLPAHAAIANGGFELGFTGWTLADQVGGDGTFLLQSGTASPVTSQLVPPPPQGTTAAMTDAQGPGSHVLYQDFIIPAPVTNTFLSFELFIGNRADAFFVADHLDFGTPDLNQQARVDILLASADPFSTLPGDVLLNVFQTEVGDPLVSGYTQQSVDVTALLNANLNTPLRLRFAEVDNVFLFQLGVDNVSLAAPAVAVNEPTPYALLLSALLALLWVRRSTRSVKT